MTEVVTGVTAEVAGTGVKVVAGRGTPCKVLPVGVTVAALTAASISMTRCSAARQAWYSLLRFCSAS